MTDPQRWMDNPATSSELRAALRQYPRPAAIPAEALEAIGAALSAASINVGAGSLHELGSAPAGASLGAAAVAKVGVVASASEPSVAANDGFDKSQLQREATLLEVGRKFLSTDPRRALEQAQVHRKQFAKPMLSLERDLIEMDALCRLGDTARAERMANEVLKVQPAGPYAERARGILARAKRDEPWSWRTSQTYAFTRNGSRVIHWRRDLIGL